MARSVTDRAADDLYRRFMDRYNHRMRESGFNGVQVKVRRDGSTDNAPGVPRAVRALPSAQGVTLVWHAATDDRGRPPAYRIYRDGSIIATVRDATWFSDPSGGQGHDYEIRAVDSSGTEGDSALLPLAGGKLLSKAGRAALKQAEASAQRAAARAAAPTGSDQAAAGASTLAAPAISGVQQSGNDAFRVQWNAVAGAAEYGVYVDDELVGSVSDPSFVGTITPGDPSVVSFDAVGADGVRSARSGAIQLAMSADGKLSAQAAQPAA